MDEARVDKWLWAARFYKTRSAATDAVVAGHVQLNGSRAKPAKAVRVGDTVAVRIGQLEWVLMVRALSDRRGSAAAAALLFEETPQSAAVRAHRSAELRSARPLGADLGARPTKQARRRIEALRRAERERRP